MPLQNPPIKADKSTYASHFTGLGMGATVYTGATGSKAVGKAAGTALLTKGSAGTDYTLAVPVAGDPGDGGDDGLVLVIITTTAYAHVVTAGAGKINGATNGTLTWTAAIGNSVVLVAYNGIWYTASKNGVAVG